MNTIGKTTIAAAFVICIVLFIGMCLFIAGFSVVEPTYMAISRNKISHRVDVDKVYFEGRHFLGVGNEFIYYPMAWQLVEYSDDDSDDDIFAVDYICKIEDTPLDAATNDGLAVEVELSLYFTIPPQQLIFFYTNFGEKYQDIIANDCKKALKDTVTKFKYEEVFKGRLNISSVMKSELTKTLARYRCVLQKVLLRGINFKSTIETNIENSVIADQAKAANEYKNKIQMINAQIELLHTEYAQRINEVVAEAQKNATITIQAARAHANSVIAESTATAWKIYQNTTGLDSETLLRIQWARTLGSSSQSDSLVLGYDKIGTQFVQKTKAT